MTTESLRIEAIEIYQSVIKLKEPFIISLGILTHAENIIVVIRTNKEITGFGECSPFMTINGESMETAYVVAGYLAKNLLGKNPLEMAELSLIMDRVIYGNSSIKSAFDIALHDIAAQIAGMPLYAWLGGRNNKTLITDYTVSLGDKEKMAGDARKIKAAGFQVIKVKLGDSAEKDIERIRLIREAIGMEIPIRMDANQGWDAESAAIVLKELYPFNIQFCEEPIPRWDFMQLPLLRTESSIPVMADESCFDHHDAKRLIDLSACKYFNVKLGKSSGIFKALKIIQLAEKAGITLQIGGFLESRLGFTASAHLALVSDTIQFCDFDTPLMFEEDPVVGGIVYSDNGKVTVPETPGLGATIHNDFLKKQVGMTIS
jgi:L-alanine-DL-glutamate epimerase-like enolase superfamily enzyme